MKKWRAGVASLRFNRSPLKKQPQMCCVVTNSQTCTTYNRRFKSRSPHLPQRKEVSTATLEEKKQTNKKKSKCEIICVELDVYHLTPSRESPRLTTDSVLVNTCWNGGQRLCVLDLFLTPAPPPGSRVALWNYLAPLLRTCGRAWRENVLPTNQRLVVVVPRTARPLACHWPCGLTDGCAAQCRQPSRIPEGSVSALISIQVVWTHAAVPVMWPTAKLFEKVTRSRQQTLTQRIFTPVEVPLESGFFLRLLSISFCFLPHPFTRPTCQRRTNSSGREATSLTSWGLWLTTPSPSLSSKTQVRQFISFPHAEEDPRNTSLVCLSVYMPNTFVGKLFF